MSCKCGSARIANVNGKTSDMCVVTMNTSEEESQGYVPRDMAIGGGDYIRFAWCLDCGKIQGAFPLLQTTIEGGEEA